MNNIVRFEVTATLETALKKLSKANIAVYRLKKRSSRVQFGVRQEYVEKVFAIFSHPCYNTVIVQKSGVIRLKLFLKRRFGLVVGACLFVAAACLSSNAVLKIKVVGNGGYLKGQIISIAADCGAREWSFCKNFDAPLMQSKIMALPDVNFCSVKRDGAYLLIDVRTDDEHVKKADYKPLNSPLSGEVYRLVAICGTPEKSEGDSVTSGEVLIGAYELSADGEKIPCLAVGFAEIKAQASVSLFFESESGENEQAAQKAALLYSDTVLETSCKVSPCEGGVKYEVNFTYLKRVAANME
ncbi:MAG: sporulation protein YqfD [Roseburia sp.]|nr:sporulation protein YqfD [Roseburia sp.]